MTKTAWGGRFAEDTHDLAVRFSESVSFDSTLAMEDIEGSMAHARMLAKIGVLESGECERILSGLEAIREEINAGSFSWEIAKEDVHMNIESRLTQDIGEVGGKLHTGRSRNDQVATDMRLWCRRACLHTRARIDALVEAILGVAEGHVDVLMPGYTHLQRAQPVRLSHHLLAWCEMLERDGGRLWDAAKRLNECPLGSGALAGTTFALDREMTAAELGFDRPTRNSLDAVSDRDFLVECLSALANCAVHLSRIGEELVLWSSQEFGFITMSDGFTTGSSIMPQKKNPDMAELVRGKSARVIGDLVTMLVLLKGLPLAYNRDLQEDKPPVFDAFATVNDCLDVLAGAIATASFDADRMRAALADGFLDATEVADYLAAKGIPFREAHHVAGGLVALAHRSGRRLAELKLAELKDAHEALDEDVYEAMEMERAVERRDLFGGPARAQVQAALKAARARLAARSQEERKV